MKKNKKSRREFILYAGALVASAAFVGLSRKNCIICSRTNNYDSSQTNNSSPLEISFDKDETLTMKISKTEEEWKFFFTSRRIPCITRKRN